MDMKFKTESINRRWLLWLTGVFAVQFAFFATPAIGTDKGLTTGKKAPDRPPMDLSVSPNLKLATFAMG